MSLAITLLDDTTAGKVVNKTILKLVSERLSLCELITQRIRAEVDKFNRQQKQEVFDA